ncbi:hypothetical protein SVAN01_10249 [Stagonosporopsis vannaccii]|nr:hypothetical protein SVAN01_10249 [Stagonosporopsis vannaccii]
MIRASTTSLTASRFNSSVRRSEPQRSQETAALGNSMKADREASATYCPGCCLLAPWYLFHTPPLDLPRSARSNVHETMPSWSNAADGVVEPCPTPFSLVCDRQWLLQSPFA